MTFCVLTEGLVVWLPELPQPKQFSESLGQESRTRPGARLLTQVHCQLSCVCLQEFSVCFRKVSVMKGEKKAEELLLIRGDKRGMMTKCNE